MTNDPGQRLVIRSLPLVEVQGDDVEPDHAATPTSDDSAEAVARAASLLYSKYGGVEIKVDAGDLLIVRGSDVRPMTERERGRLSELRAGISTDLQRLQDLAS